MVQKADQNVGLLAGNRPLRLGTSSLGKPLGFLRPLSPRLAVPSSLCETRRVRGRVWWTERDPDNTRGEFGITDLDDDPTMLVESAAGPRLWFQKVTESKTVKNRNHIDVRSSNRSAEVERLLRLGATVLGERPELSLTAMHDPEGHEFCITE